MPVTAERMIGLGAALGSVGALGLVVWPLLGWSQAPRPWGFLLGLCTGVLAGLGGSLVVAGLLRRRRQARR